MVSADDTSMKDDISLFGLSYEKLRGNKGREPELVKSV